MWKRIMSPSKAIDEAIHAHLRLSGDLVRFSSPQGKATEAMLKALERRKAEYVLRFQDGAYWMEIEDEQHVVAPTRALAVAASIYLRIQEQGKI